MAFTLPLPLPRQAGRLGPEEGAGEGRAKESSRGVAIAVEDIFGRFIRYLQMPKRSHRQNRNWPIELQKDWQGLSRLVYRAIRSHKESIKAQPKIGFARSLNWRKKGGLVS
jgi:hypothetical protein